MKNISRNKAEQEHPSQPMARRCNPLVERLRTLGVVGAGALLTGALAVSFPGKAHAGDMFQGCNIPTPVMLELNASEGNFTLLPKIKPHESLFIAAPISVDEKGDVSPALVVAATPVFQEGKSNLFIGLKSSLEKFKHKFIAAFTRLFAGGSREASVLAVADPANGKVSGDAVIGLDIQSAPGLRLGLGFEGIGSGDSRLTFPVQLKKGNVILRGSASADSGGKITGELGVRILFP